MNEHLLWDLEETARQLGVCTRTVRRLIMRGEIPAVRVGRCIRVPARGVHDWLEKSMHPAHNPDCAEPGVRKEFTCHTVAKTVQFGGSVTSTQAVRELGVLLKQPTARKQRR